MDRKRLQHLDQSLSHSGPTDETFPERPFGIFTSCVDVEWRLKRRVVFRDSFPTEDCCEINWTFIVHTPPLEILTGVWLLAYQHLTRAQTVIENRNRVIGLRKIYFMPSDFDWPLKSCDESSG